MPRLAVILITLLLLGEGILALWRSVPIAPSTDPVFTFPPAAANFDNPGPFASAVRAYAADRGAEWNHTTGEGKPITVFYFEWDKVHVRPTMAIVGHSPEECNVAAGFTLQSVLEPRQHHTTPGHPPIVFDATQFTTPSGRSVHMFKTAWVQGLGSRELREAQNRLIRLQNSFIRHNGAARVLQAGIFDADDPDHAWQIFQRHVLDALEWKTPHP